MYKVEIKYVWEMSDKQIQIYETMRKQVNITSPITDKDIICLAKTHCVGGDCGCFYGTLMVNVPEEGCTFKVIDNGKSIC